MPVGQGGALESLIHIEIDRRTDPAALEGEINQIAGVVTNGLFARRGADLLLVGTDSGVETLKP